jgi:hypothetical protein
MNIIWFFLKSGDILILDGNKLISIAEFIEYTLNHRDHGQIQFLL